MTEKLTPPKNCLKNGKLRYSIFGTCTASFPLMYSSERGGGGGEGSGRCVWLSGRCVWLSGRWEVCRVEWEVCMVEWEVGGVYG